MQVTPIYNKLAAITKSNTVNIPEGATDAVYIGTAGATGTIVAVMQSGATATFVGIVAGTILPIKVIRINSTTTDASNMLALYCV